MGLLEQDSNSQKTFWMLPQAYTPKSLEHKTHHFYLDFLQSMMQQNSMKDCRFSCLQTKLFLFLIISSLAQMTKCCKSCNTLSMFCLEGDLASGDVIQALLKVSKMSKIKLKTENQTPFRSSSGPSCFLEAAWSPPHQNETQ